MLHIPVMISCTEKKKKNIYWNYGAEKFNLEMNAGHHYQQRALCSFFFCFFLQMARYVVKIVWALSQWMKKKQKKNEKSVLNPNRKMKTEQKKKKTQVMDKNKIRRDEKKTATRKNVIHSVFKTINQTHEIS